RAAARTVADAEVAPDVREDRDVHVLEESIANEIGLGCDQLLRDTRPDLDRTGKVVALHELLDRDRGRDDYRLTRVVPLAVTGCAFDQRIMVGDAGLLRGLRDAIDVAAERDHGLPRAPGGDPRGRYPGDSFLDRESVLTENADQVFRRLDFLKAELAIAEDLIDHLLRELRHGVHAGDGFTLQRSELVVGDRLTLRFECWCEGACGESCEGEGPSHGEIGVGDRRIGGESSKGSRMAANRHSGSLATSRPEGGGANMTPVAARGESAAPCAINAWRRAGVVKPL